jgi:hypothetical protein
MKSTNTPSGQNAELLAVKAGSTYTLILPQIMTDGD